MIFRLVLNELGKLWRKKTQPEKLVIKNSSYWWAYTVFITLLYIRSNVCFLWAKFMFGLRKKRRQTLKASSNCFDFLLRILSHFFFLWTLDFPKSFQPCRQSVMSSAFAESIVAKRFGVCVCVCVCVRMTWQITTPAAEKMSSNERQSHN